MSDFHRLALIAVLFAGITVAAQPSRVSALPTDLCGILQAADVSKTLGQTYDAPQESVAPRPFPGTNTGTDCNYDSKRANGKLWFRIYVDPSAAAATDLFAKLKVYYSPPTAVSKLGDEAYLDPQHALHVRKGKVRFYLNLSPVGDAASTEKLLKKLAGEVVRAL
jgi:hypothetical protein